MRHKRTDSERFWLRVDKRSDDECWPWKAGLTHDGYGRFYSQEFQADKMRAHRFSFYLAYGRFPMPNGLHRCDNRVCVNPTHIFEGTLADNIADCISKGRFRPGVCLGEKNHKSKLNPDKVRQIRELYRSGIGLADLGRNFGVSAPSISAIIKGKNWKHVSELRREGKIKIVGTRKTRSGSPAAVYQII